MERKAFFLAAAGIICGLGASLVSGVVPEAWKALVLYIGVVLIALGLLGATIAVLWPSRQRRTDMSDKDESEMGDYNTFYGNVKPPKRIGHGNTIVGPTDDRGNTIIGGGTSVGYGAGRADPTSVFIGAFAGSKFGKKPEDETGGK